MHDTSSFSNEMTFGDLWSHGSELLQSSGVERPREDSGLLLKNAGALTSAELISKAREKTSPETQARFLRWLQLRAAGTPVYRIVGERSFYGREFKLSAATLEPRSDTELLIDVVKESFGQSQFHFLEIGTGTGCIAVSIACEAFSATGIASDISDKALVTANENIRRHGVSDRIESRMSDLFRDIEGRYDLIVSNPPYIPTQEIGNLAREVRLHDPILALDGGTDGLDHYRALLGDARPFLKPNGKMILEIGVGQAESVCGLANRNDWTVSSVHTDLAGIERVICLK